MLSLKPAGENNSNVTLLTPDKGIIYATLYGGPKSKLKSLVSLYNCGTIWLYESPEKNQIKEPILKTSGGNWINLSDFKSLFNTFLVLHNPTALFKGGNLEVDNSWNYYKWKTNRNG